MTYSHGFESYDARLLFRSSDPQVLELGLAVARKSLLGNIEEHRGPYDATFDLERTKAGNLRLTRNEEQLSDGDEDLVLGYLDDMVRISVAEFSKNFVFVHAGAVGWRGKAILLPAMSFQGKSSFVTELVKAGAEYYSDDFAILDEFGHLHPFARQISMRTRDGSYGTYEIDPRDLGARLDHRPVPVGLVLLTQYVARARWQPRVLTNGEGVLATLPFAIPLRRYPEKCLRVLDVVASTAKFIQTFRGDARRAAPRLLQLADEYASD